MAALYNMTISMYPMAIDMASLWQQAPRGASAGQRPPPLAGAGAADGNRSPSQAT